MFNNSPVKLKVNVQPVFISMVHKEAYMGPCRYGAGEELTTEYDEKVAAEVFEKFKSNCKEKINMENANVFEPVFVSWCEDFAITEEEYKKATARDSEVDFYLVTGTRIASYFTCNLGKRTGKVVSFIPPESVVSKCDMVDTTAHMRALGKEAYAFYDFNDVNRTLELFRVKKALKETTALFALKSAVLNFGCQSSFLNLSDVTDRFGMQFKHVNSEDIFTALDKLTEEDKAEARRITEELVKGAKALHMEEKYLYNDVEYYIAVKKLMDLYDSNAFTVPCFEVCATQEIMKRQLTFCLTHSILKDEGIAGSCAGDVGSIVSLSILMNLAKKAPHMGNTMIMDRENNVMRVLHDVASRKMKGFDTEDLPIEYVSFTKGDWGATMRYDFALDKGEDITLVNLSPDMKKIMIAKGTITGCDNYLMKECKHAVRFEVKDCNDFFNKQMYVGHHFSWVYGDYVDKLVELAEMLGLEPLVSA